MPGSTLKPLVKLPKDPAACWPYLGAIHHETGYATKQWHGKTYLAHRWLWMQLFGPLPDGIVLQNTCGTKSCINPHHWTATTMTELSRQGVQTILTPGDVVEIKRYPKDKLQTSRQRAVAAHDLAGRFGCSTQLIYDVWGGRAWRPSHKPARTAAVPAGAVAASKGD